MVAHGQGAAKRSNARRAKAKQARKKAARDAVEEQTNSTVGEVIPAVTEVNEFFFCNP